jgi:hypothetical protein
MQDAHDFTATEYRLAASSITVQERGHGRWAVCNGNMVLDNHDQWGPEPLPSSRTDEWLVLYRFDSLDAAFAAARRAHWLDMDELRKLNDKATTT